MLWDTDARRYLEGQLHRPEAGRSSHWEAPLADFSVDSGRFRGRGLPEGRGYRNLPLYRYGHWLFQTPFRLQGRKFKRFPQFMAMARQIHRRRGSLPDLAMIRQALTLALIDHEIAIETLADPIVVIGDGFGAMASLLSLDKRVRAKVVVINLTAPLLLDAEFIDRSLEGVAMCLATNVAEYGDAVKNDAIRVVLVQADNADFVREKPVGLAINIASMQEMNPPVTENYFRLLRCAPGPRTVLYCCNRVQKALPDGTVTRFLDYPWQVDDELLLDELCPWQQFYYDIRPPFYHPNDGAVRHRLAILQKES